MGMGGKRHAPAASSPGRSSGTYRTGGRMGPRDILDMCEENKIFCFRRYSNPEPSSP
jgi:hypothetical protein